MILHIFHKKDHRTYPIFLYLFLVYNIIMKNMKYFIIHAINYLADIIHYLIGAFIVVFILWCLIRIHNHFSKSNKPIVIKNKNKNKNNDTTSSNNNKNTNKQ